MIFGEKVKKLGEIHLEEIRLLSGFNKEIMGSIKELNDTNYFMFSSTSIEGGYSNYKIEAEQS